MSDQPQTWHYGLVAQWWAEFNTAEPGELAFYRGFIEDGGQPALDLACGTGRLLLPLLRAGLDVDGLRPFAGHARPLPPAGRAGGTRAAVV